MKNSMKVLACSCLLAACGGSGGNAALSKSFTYGAPAAPTTQESSAASSAQGNLSQTASFGASPDASKGASIIGFADSLAAAVLGGAAIPGRGPSADDITHAVRSATADFNTCSTVTANSVTFSNCQIVESGFTVTLNGHINASANSVTWAITGGFSGVSSGYTINVVNHQAGSLTVSATTIAGNATSDFSGSISGQNQNVNFGLATAVVLDLTYTSSPNDCVTSGTAEVKRVWTTRPNGASGAQFDDAAVKFTWTGCNLVQVAHGK